MANASLYNATLLLGRLRARNAAPASLVRMTETYLRFLRKLEGGPPCASVADWQAGRNVSGADLCLNETVLGQQPTRPFNVSVPPVLLWNDPQQKPQPFHPFLTIGAYKFFGDFRCSVVTGHKRQDMNLGCNWPRALPNRSLIFVSTFSLDHLVKALPRLPHFFLVTHWTDLPVADSKTTRSLLASPKLLFWFANSLELEHPRLFPLPIGLQDDQAQKIKATLMSNVSHETTGLLLAKFRVPGTHPNDNALYRRYVKRRGEAAVVFKTFPNVTTKKMGREMYYAEILRHRFTLSPPGNNHDCYRTWEILALGRIPILKSLPAQDPMFEGLPVVIVRDWAELTPKLLEERWAEIIERRFVMDKVTMFWWWLYLLKMCLLTP